MPAIGEVVVHGVLSVGRLVHYLTGCAVECGISAVIMIPGGLTVENILSPGRQYGSRRHGREFAHPTAVGDLSRPSADVHALVIRVVNLNPINPTFGGI